MVSAFPQAKAQDLCYIEPPDEWWEVHPGVEGDVVLRMDKFLYGRRTAPRDFREHLERILTSSEFAVGGNALRRHPLAP